MAMEMAMDMEREVDIAMAKDMEKQGWMEY